MTTAKMRIKMGPIEIDYEGSEDFLKQELPAILTAVSSLHKESGLVENSPPGANSGNGAAGSNQTAPIGMSVTTISAKLGVKSGADLALAAAARLTRGGSSSFSRQQLLDEMKAATGFYKTTIRSNLSNYLLTLVKEGKLQETAKDTYSLSMATKTEIEAKLAG